MLKALSLFSGCGGMDLGAQLAGFEIVEAYDNDEDSVTSYNKNLDGEAAVADVLDLVSRKFSRIELLLGGPPCQGFSTAGSKRRDDPRNTLWEVYVEILAKLLPQAFLLENVLGFQAHEAQFRNALQIATRGAYSVEFRKLNAQSFNVPQHRYRIFVIGLRKEFSLHSRWPKAVAANAGGYKERVPGLVSIRSALASLGPPGIVPKTGKVLDQNDHVSVPLEGKHGVIGVHIPNGGSLKDIPDQFLLSPYRGRDRIGNPGWFWYYRKPECDLPGRTVLAMMTPTFATAFAPDVFYEKMGGCWNWVAVDPTKHRNRSGLYTSPVAPRRLSIRECARLQTFPDWFVWEGNAASQHRQIGNAVPCELAQRLCEAIRAVLDGSAPVKEDSEQLELFC